MRNLISLVTALILVALPVAARDAASLKTELPTVWQGTFAWAGDTNTQKVAITFDNVINGAAGKVWAFGNGTYDAGNVTSIVVRALVDPETLGLRMWEATPKNYSGSFVTDGEHKGSLSADLKTITTVWTTKSNGQQGNLTLNAR